MQICEQILTTDLLNPFIINPPFGRSLNSHCTEFARSIHAIKYHYYTAASDIVSAYSTTFDNPDFQSHRKKLVYVLFM